MARRRVGAHLATEPTVLAPQPALQAEGRRARRLRAWMAPAAVAAGFVAVAGALVVTRVGAPEGEAGDRLAEGAVAPAAPVVQVSATAGTGSLPAAPALADTATVIRSSELDRYLAAHRQRAGIPPPAAPRGDVRNVSVTGPGR